MIDEELVKEFHKCLNDKSYFAKKYLNIDISRWQPRQVELNRDETQALIIWNLVFQYNRNVVILSEGDEKAKKYISELKDKLALIPFGTSVVEDLKRSFTTNTDCHVVSIIDEIGLKGRTIDILVFDDEKKEDITVYGVWTHGHIIYHRTCNKCGKCIL